MRKRLFGLIALGTGLLVSAMSVAQPTEQTSTSVNVEMPFRCSVKHFGDLDVATTISLKPTDFQLTYFDQMDSLPRYEVNGLSFDKMPVDEAVQRLVDEAGIEVYTEDGYYADMNADDVYGELTDVLNELTAAGGLFYRYDASQKELYLSRTGRFELQLPDNRMVMLAMLDSLRGAGIKNIRPDWKNNTILLSITQAEKEKVEELTRYIIQDGYLVLADTQLYRVAPASPRANWQSVVQAYGPARVYSVSKGINGQLLTLGNQRPAQTFLKALAGLYNITPVSQGVAIVPNGWKMRFNVAQCAPRGDLGSLSVLLNAYVKSPDKVDTNITFDSRGGEIATFNATAALDDEMIIFGIPYGLDAGSDQLMATLKLRMIRFVKEQKNG